MAQPNQAVRRVSKECQAARNLGHLIDSDIIES